MANYLAEFIGTFALILVGAGSVCADVLSGGKLGITGIAFAHGLTIMVMIYAYGHISGAHFNPAVTVPMWLTRRIPLRQAVGYVVAQLAGASVAGLLLSRLVGSLVYVPPYLGTCALTNTTVLGGVVLEAILTFFLVSVIWGMAVDPRSPKPPVGLAIGFTVTLDILMGGYFTGAAMNPARAFGPALATGHWTHQAVYWIGPLLGGCAAGVLYDTVFLKKHTS